jgi:hypothetical protein
MDADVQERAALAADDAVLARDLGRELVGVQSVEEENVLAEIFRALGRRQDAILRRSGVDRGRRLTGREACYENEASQRADTSNHAPSHESRGIFFGVTPDITRVQEDCLAKVDRQRQRDHRGLQ